MIHAYYQMHVLALALALCCVSHADSAPMSFAGAIRFPKVHDIPPIEIYSHGCRIQGMVDNATHQITYAINRQRHLQRFWIVISHHLIPVICEDAENNTIKCWRVNTKYPYQFYALTRIIDDTVNSQEAPRARWDVQSYDLTPLNGQLPDDTIIIYYDPVLIAEVRGGGPFELPTIIIKDDIVAMLGSEEALHDLSERLSIAAVDLRHFFSPVEYEIRQTAQVKTIIALSTT